MTKANKDKKLTWVYPLNNHSTICAQTFIYGYSNPKAELYIEIEQKQRAGESESRRKIKVFPNGNFAQVVKLPFKRNVIRLVQVLDGKKRTINRIVSQKKESSKIGRKREREDSLYTSSLSPYFSDSPFLRLVVDPGHGGKEHGTHSPKGVPEKTFNLQISKMLVKALPRIGKVYLTRSTDKFVSLNARVNFAKKKKCDLFISIHHNALPDNEDPLKHRGIGIYYTHDNLKPLAKKFLDGICKNTGLKKYGLFKRDFRVIKQSYYIGILIECGFLIHPVESEIITNRKMQEKIVKGIISSIW